MKDKDCPNCGFPLRLDGQNKNVLDWSCFKCGFWGRHDFKKNKWLLKKMKTLKKVLDKRLTN